MLWEDYFGAQSSHPLMDFKRLFLARVARFPARFSNALVLV